MAQPIRAAVLVREFSVMGAIVSVTES